MVIRPATRVYVGRNFEIPAVISQVGIRGCGCPIYTVDWWSDEQHCSLYLERFQFSLVKGEPDEDIQEAN